MSALHSIVSCRFPLSLIPACCVHISLRYCPASPALLSFALVPCVLPLVVFLASCCSLSFGPCTLYVPRVHPVCYCFGQSNQGYYLEVRVFIYPSKRGLGLKLRRIILFLRQKKVLLITLRLQPLRQNVIQEPKFTTNSGSLNPQNCRQVFLGMIGCLHFER